MHFKLFCLFYMSDSGLWELFVGTYGVSRLPKQTQLTGTTPV